MAAGDTQVLRERLVVGLRAAGQLRDERVAEAFLAVPRHVFLPGVEPDCAYRDEVFPVKFGEDGRPVSSSSQPAIMARMLEQLDIAPGQRILEIGTGTGYNAALLAHLAGPAGSVVTIDLDEDLVADARDRLAACGLPEVTVVCGDGAQGWPQDAPFDRIIVTVGAWDLFPAWTGQLARSGRLVVPLDLQGVQRSVAFAAAGDHFEALSAVDCGFMRMRGASAGPEVTCALGSGSGVFLSLARPRPLDTGALTAALAESGEDIPTGVHVTLREIWGGLGLWLALTEPALGVLSALGAAADRGLVPALFTIPQRASTIVLLGGDAFAALVRHPGDGQVPGLFELAARPFGPAGQVLASRLTAHVRAWDARKRPGTGDLHIAAYPRHSGSIPSADAIIDKHHCRLALRWNHSGGHR